MALSTCTAAGTVVGVILTVLVYVLVLPKSKDGKLNKFFQFLHDFFRFKNLYIEGVLRFFYTLQTILCITVGLFLLFGKMSVFGLGSSSTFLFGLGLIILGPIIVRITYELAMLSVILTTNTIDINNKLGGSNKGVKFNDGEELTNKFAEKAGQVAGKAADAAMKAKDDIGKGQNQEK